MINGGRREEARKTMESQNRRRNWDRIGGGRRKNRAGMIIREGEGRSPLPFYPSGREIRKRISEKKAVKKQLHGKILVNRNRG